MKELKKYFSDKKYLELLYIILITIFSLIIQLSIIRPFFALDFGTLDCIIVVILSFMALELEDKRLKSEIIVLILLILGGVAITIVHGGQDILRYLVIIIFHVIVVIATKCDEIASAEVKEKASRMIIGIFLSAIGLLSNDKSYFLLIGQLSIAFFIMYIYILRALRNFHYKLNKDSLKNNVLYVILMLTLLIDGTQKIFVKIFNLFMVVVAFILEKLIEMLIYFFGPIMMKLKIDPKSAEVLFKQNKTNYKDIDSDKTKSILEIFGITVDVAEITNIIISVLIVFILYKIFKSIYLKLGDGDNREGVRIERERVVKNKKIKKYIKIKKPITVKEKISYYYREFLLKAKNKKLYKEYMTARQVQSRVGAEVYELQKELKFMTDIYNEAKFSNHEISEEKLAKFKESYDKVHNKL